jgi:hypothetical protein
MALFLPTDWRIVGELTNLAAQLNYKHWLRN